MNNPSLLFIIKALRQASIKQPDLARATSGKAFGSYWGNIYWFTFAANVHIGIIVCTAQKC